MNPVAGTTTLGHLPNTVKLEVTRTETRHGVIHGHFYLRLADGSLAYEGETIENVKYAIPEGIYNTTFEWSERFQRQTPRLQVPNRTYIEIHPAKNAYRLLGCIGVSLKDFDALVKLLPQTQAFRVFVSSEQSD
jgi:hypothetical protein